MLAVAAAGSGAGFAAGQFASPAQVVHAWSKALNANDNRAAGALFAPNAHVIQPGIDGLLASRALAVAFNNLLPCAGRIVALSVHGTRVVTTFVLGRRPKHRCDAPGAKAAALIVVKRGRIVIWEQVAVPPPAASAPTA